MITSRLLGINKAEGWEFIYFFPIGGKSNPHQLRFKIESNVNTISEYLSRVLIKLSDRVFVCLFVSFTFILDSCCLSSSFSRSNFSTCGKYTQCESNSVCV